MEKKIKRRRDGVPKKRITLTVDAETLKAFRELCRRSEESMSSVISDFMSKVVGKTGK